MKLQTRIQFSKAKNQIDHQSQLLLLGSCFANNIGDKLGYFKFQRLQNPFGVLFHPFAIENLISRSVKGVAYTENDIFFLNERWHCFDAHSDLSNTSKEKILDNLNKGLERTNKLINKATHIIITLGTAWGYLNTGTNRIVANCHKVTQHEFSKELVTKDTVLERLRNIVDLIESINKNVRFIFTVSPVRHLKDGFAENQRSKAHLIAAIHQLIDNATSAGKARLAYFESYELMMDELRDYRFYKTDMVHPNGLAIEYIWEKFAKVWVSPKAHAIMEKVATIQKGLQHRPFDEHSEQHQQFLKSLEDKITYLQEAHPFMTF